MRNKIYIIIPRLENTGAIKGAMAICNSLVSHLSITLICLKGIGNYTGLKQDVKIISLGKEKSFYKKYSAIKKLLKNDDTQPLIISLCFSADLMNFFLRKKARIIASVRGDLLTAYRKNYGLLGSLMALLHHQILCQYNHVLVISEAMRKQVEHLKLKRLSVVNNFIDEPQLEPFRLTSSDLLKDNKEKTIIYLGSFTKRKRVDLLIQAAESLSKRNDKFRIIMLGEGPLGSSFKTMVQENNLDNIISFLGHVDEPYPKIQQADLVVLPSESEGVPRSILESLFFGIPCIVRNVCANAELIQDGVNGYLFEHDHEFEPVLEKALSNTSLKASHSLIPPSFCYEKNTKKLLKIIKDEISH
jgi:glycosyltransferase involved in cell wall biosynthesis